MPFFQKIAFVILFLFCLVSLYYGHFNFAVIDMIILVLVFFKQRYPKSAILRMLLRNVTPVPRKGIAHSQYIAELILLHTTNVFILWSSVVVLFYFNPNIFKNLSTIPSQLIAVVMSMLIILLALQTILFTFNLIQYLYIKLFNKDFIY